MFYWSKLWLTILISLLATKPSCAARFQVMGHRDENQYVHLKSQYDIAPGAVLRLPIDVPEDPLGVDGLLAPRLRRIDAIVSDGIYGGGDEILITLEFYSEVNVSGAPTLTVNTGCHSDDCITKEQQQFFCAADSGYFAIRMGDQFIMNINANTTQDELKYKLQELRGVHEVTVSYSDADDRPYSGGKRVCTSAGNSVNVTFEAVLFPEFDGDVPTLTFDDRNRFPDLRTGLYQGLGDDNRLSGLHQAYDVNLTDAAVELQKGHQQRDGTASYVAGSGSSVLTFSYIVRPGDFSLDLDVLSINFDTGYIYSPLTLQNVSSALPGPQVRSRYMNGSPASLAFGRGINISTDPAVITKVSSPDPDGIYTVGDIIDIAVYFDLPIKVYGNIYLLLKPGSFLRMAPLLDLEPTQKMILTFQYRVQIGDFADDLDYQSTDSIVLNGGFIYRASPNNATVVNLTLPTVGSQFSLAGQKNLIVETNPPVLLDFFLSQTGIYTSGDAIYFHLRYNRRVVVSGQPRLWVQNSPRALNAKLQTAPAIVEWSYHPVKAGAADGGAFIILDFILNWDMSAADFIDIHLPGFVGQDVSHLSLGGVSSSLLSGTWDSMSQSIRLNLTGDSISSKTDISLTIDARNGISVGSEGVMSSLAEITLSVFGARGLVHSAPFNTIQPVGFKEVALTLSSLMPGVYSATSLKIITPDLLAVSDIITLFFTGFSSNRSVSTLTNDGIFQIVWNHNQSKLELLVLSTVVTTSVDILLTDYFPLVTPVLGSSRFLVKVEADMEKNGFVAARALSALTSICSAGSNDDGLRDENVRVIYTTESLMAGDSTAVEFKFWSGLSGFLRGDSIAFSLPSATFLGISSSDITDYMHVTINGVILPALRGRIKVEDDLVVFDVTSEVGPSLAIKVMVSEFALLKVPSLRKNVDMFNVFIESSQCVMSHAQSFLFDYGILSVSTPTLSFASPYALNGGAISMTLSFILDVAITSGDKFVLTIPNFAKNIELPVDDNSFVTSSFLVGLLFDRARGQLLFTALQNYIPMSGPTQVSFTLSQASGLSLPRAGVAYESVMLMVDTAEGLSLLHVVDNDCVGFCGGSVFTLIPFAAAASTIEVHTVFSNALPISTQLTLSGIDTFSLLPSASQLRLGVGPWIKESIKVDGIVTWYDVTNWMVSSDSLILTLPISIAAEAGFILLLSNVQILTPGISDFIVSVKSTTLKPSGTDIKYSLFTPKIYPSFEATIAKLDLKRRYASVDLGNKLCGEPVELIFSFQFNEDILAGYAIDFSLPGFKMDVLGYSVDSRDFSEYLSSVSGQKWLHEPSYTISIDVDILIPAGTDVNFTIYGFTAPAAGVVAGDASPTYSVRTSAVLVDSHRPLHLVRDVPALYNINISYSYRDVNKLDVSSFLFSFTSNKDLFLGDTIEILVPGLLGTESQSLMISGIMASAIFTPSESHGILNGALSGYLKLSITSSIPRGALSFSVGCYDLNSSRLLFMPPSGYHEATVGYLILFSSIDGSGTSFPYLVPCFGICSAIVHMPFPKAGFDTDLNIAVNVHNFLSVGDVLSFELRGFERNWIGTEFVNSHSHVGGTFRTDILLEWNSSRSTLDVKVLSLVTPTSSLSFTIRRLEGFILPIEGVPVDAKYYASYSSAMSSQNRFLNSVLEVDPVGSIMFSSVLAPVRTVGKDIDLIIRLQLYNSIRHGDSISIVLPLFSVAASPHIINATVRDSMGTVSSVLYAVGVQGASFGVPSTITLTLAEKDSLVSPAALITILLEKAYFRINLPSVGIQESVRPQISIESDLSPVILTPVSNYTAIGALSPATLSITYDRFNNTITVVATFSVKCAWEEGAILTIRLSNVVGTGAATHAEIISPLVAVNPVMSSMWDEAISSLVIVVNGTAVPSGLFSLQVTSEDLSLTSDIVHQNIDGNFYHFSAQSARCPVDQTEFSSSIGTILSTSALTFRNPVAGEISSIDFNFNTLDGFKRGDFIVLRLPQFSCSSCVGNCSVSFNAHSSFSTNVTLQVLSDEIKMTFTLSDAIGKGVTLAMHMPDWLNISLPASGVRLNKASHVSVAITYDLPNTVNFAGPVEFVQAVGAFTFSSVVLTNPIAGHCSDINFAFQLPFAINSGDTVSLALPGFTMTLFRPDLSIYPVSITGNASKHYFAQWIPSPPTIVMTAITDVVSDFSLNMLTAMDCIRIPATGVASPTKDYRVSVGSLNGNIASISTGYFSLVPYIERSIVSFVSASALDSYAVGSSIDDHSVLLVPGHDLNDMDIGDSIVIEGTMYTIIAYKDNKLTFVEKYVGPLVVLSEPTIFINTSELRPAVYFNGSGSDELIFRYVARRGDLSDTVTVYDLSVPTNVWVVEEFELNGGSILRFSQNPELPVDRNLPDLVGGEYISIEAVRPKVLRVSSTLIGKSAYSFGDLVDFQVQFSHRVSVNTSVPASPGLLLHLVNDKRIGVARYSSGSGSDTLTFVWTVLADMYETDASKLIAGSPIIQPLRVIMNNYFDYIRRTSTFPTLDIFENLPSASIDIHQNISISSSAPNVEEIIVMAAPDGTKTFSAGDTIYLLVRYTSAVQVWLESPAGAVPTILLDMTGPPDDSGTAISPGVAKFTRMLDKKTLVFEYLVVPTDSLISDGLYIHCDCDDYFSRSFIKLNDNSLILYENSYGISAVVSLMISAGSSSAARLVDRNVVIDNSVPIVLSATANITRNAVLVPGSSILIYIQFSSRIISSGNIKLILHSSKRLSAAQGATTYCSARLAGGSGTSTLSFLYRVSVHSALSRLACNAVDSLDLSGGSIKKYSSIPVIDVNPSMVSAGSYRSLGFNTDISIDTSNLLLKRVYVNGNAFLSAPSFSVYHDTTNANAAANVYYLYGTGAEDKALAFDAVSDVQLALVYSVEDSQGVDATKVFSCEHYDSLLVESKSAGQLSSVSLLSTSTSGPQHLENTLMPPWWSSYVTQSFVDIYFEYDRPALSRDKYVSLNTGAVLNRAVSSECGSSWLVSIDVFAARHSTKKLVEGLPDQNVFQFRLQFDDLVTACIAVRGNANEDQALAMASEMQFRLRGINLLRQRGVRVAPQESIRDGVVTFLVTTERGGDEMLVAFDEFDFSSCGDYNVPPEFISVQHNTRVCFRYPIQDSGMLLLQATQDIPVGNLSISINSFLHSPRGYSFRGRMMENGFSIRRAGVDPNSIKMTHISGKSMGIRSSRVLQHNGIASVPFSGLEIHSRLPGLMTGLSISLIVNREISLGDSLELYLPGFNSLLSPADQLVPQLLSTGYFDVIWDSSSEKVRLNCFKSIPALEHFSLELAELQLQLVAPATATYENSKDYTFSLLLNHSSVFNKQFSFLSGVGMHYFKMNLTNPLPAKYTGIDFVFSPTFDVPYNSTIRVQLPGFLRENFEGNRTLDVTGPFSHIFSAEWFNGTSSIYMINLVELPADKEYLIRIEQCSRVNISVHGLSGDYVVLEPPTMSLETSESGIFIARTILSKYSRVFGLLSSRIELEVIQSSADFSVDQILISLNFSKITHGPFDIVVKIPCLRYFENTLALNISTDTEGVQSDSDVFLTWNGYQETLQLSVPSMFQNNSFSFNWDPVGQFSVCNRGIPAKNHGVFISIIGVIEKDTVDGAEHMVTLSDYPVHFMSTVPVIVSSLVRFDSVYIPAMKKTRSRPFVAGYFKPDIRISVTVNTAVLPDDYFDFLLYGIQRTGHNSSVVTLSGASASFSTAEFIGNSILRLRIINESKCCTEHFHLNWILPADLNPGYFWTSKVSQYTSGAFTIKWNNSHMVTDFVHVDSPPSVGIVHSSISFKQPYAGFETSVQLTLVTATNLSVGDALVVTLPNIDTPSSWTQDYILDNVGRKWVLLWNSSAYTLSIISSTFVPPTGIQFSFGEGNDLVCTLPASGFSKDYSGFTIAIIFFEDLVKQTLLSRPTELFAQRIMDIDVVGGILFGNISIIQRSYPINTHALETFHMLIDLKLTNGLSRGDTLRVVMPNLALQQHNAAVVLSGYSAACFEVWTDILTNSLRCEVSCETVDSYVRFSVLSDADSIIFRDPLSDDGCLSESDCAATVSVTSQTCPVKETAVPTVTIRLFSAPQLLFNRTMGAPVDLRLQFVALAPLPAGFIISLNLLGVVELNSNLIADVSVFGVKEDTLWDDTRASKSIWDGSFDKDSAKLELHLQESVNVTSSGPIFLRVTSYNLSLTKGAIIYETNSHLTYNVGFGGLVIENEQFKSIDLSAGLFDASVLVDIGDPYSIFFNFSTSPASSSKSGPDDYFSRLDNISFYLPGFSGLGSPSCNIDLSVMWDEGNSVVTLAILESASAVVCNFSASRIGFACSDRSSCNATVSMQKASLNTGAMTYFPSSPLRNYYPLRVVSSAVMDILNEAPLAGHIADIQFNFSLNFLPLVGDIIEIALPKFWASGYKGVQLLSSSCLDTSIACYEYNVEWDACSEVLIVSFVAIKYFSQTASDLRHSVSIRGLSLPTEGIDEELAKSITIATFSTSRQFHCAPSVAIGNIPMIGYIPMVSVKILNPLLNEETTFLFSFKLSKVLLVGDSISLFLPDVIYTPGDVIVAAIMGTIKTNVTASWVSAQNLLVFTAITDIKPGIVHSILVGNETFGFILPNCGFPTLAMEYADIMISTNSAGGPVHWTPIGTETSSILHSVVGIVSQNTNIKLNLIAGSVTAPLKSVTLQFQFSHELSIGDVLVFQTPSVISKDNMSLLFLPFQISGSDGVSASSLSLAFSSLSRNFSITIFEAQPAFKIISIVISGEGKLFVDGEIGTADVDHFISGNISAFGGVVTSRRIQHSPDDIIAVSDEQSHIDLSCSYGGSYLCEMKINVALHTPISAGDFLSFSHRSFFKEPYRSLFDPKNVNVYLRDSSIASQDFSPAAYYVTSFSDPIPPAESYEAAASAKVSLSGNGAAFFRSNWRNADKLSQIDFVSNLIIDADSVGADISRAELTASSELNTFAIPAFIPALFEEYAAIIADIPEIIDVFVVNSRECLVPGDSLDLIVQFSEPVAVIFEFGSFNFTDNGSQDEHFGLRILLNTAEVAHYVSGSGTTELHFVYHITQNAENVTDLAVAGPHAIDFSSRGGRVVFASNHLLRANTTVPKPYGASLLRLKAGNRVPIQVSSLYCPAQVVSAQLYSRPGSTLNVSSFIEGDVLDIVLHFNRDVIIKPGYYMYEEGIVLQNEEFSGRRIYVTTIATHSYIGPSLLPSLFIPGLIDNNPFRPTALQLNFVNVSRVQWLFAYNDGDFALSVDGATSGCVKWNDINKLLAEVRVLSSMALSLPVHANIYPIDNGFKYELIFEGRVAPSVLRIQKHICESESLSAEIKLPPAALSSLVFRRIITADDYGHNSSLAHITHLSRGNVTEFMSHIEDPPTGSIHPNIADSVIFTATTTLLTEAKKNIPLSIAGNIFKYLNFEVDASSVTILCISSNFLNRNLQPLASAGDDIFIDVQFSRSVVVSGYPSLAIQISVASDQWRGVQPFAEYYETLGNVARFRYRVHPGDIATFISINGSNALSLRGGSIKSEALKSKTDVILSTDIACTLNASGIQVDGTLIPTIFDIAVLDIPPGAYGAGQIIKIALLFPTIITLKFSDALVTPSIRLNVSNFDSYASYMSGSGSNCLVFEYNVTSKDNSRSLAFMYPNISKVVSAQNGCFELHDGLFVDKFGNEWSVVEDCPLEENNQIVFELGKLNFQYEKSSEMYLNVLSHLSTTMSNIAIDSSVPIVVRVTSSNEDGTYQPGEVVDITVVFNKDVVLLATNNIDNFPQLALFIPYQDMNNIFAIYTSGNGTSKLHFTYLMPHPPEGWFIRPLVRLDYAGTASLLEHLNGWTVFRASTFPTTEANVLLPAEDVSYIGIDRDIRLDFNSAEIISIAAVNRSGTYTAGDAIVVEVNFSQPVMVIVPPVLRLETGKVDRDATYLSGNNTKSLLFVYLILVGDSNDDLDYVDTRISPYNQATYKLSFALNTDVIRGNSGRLYADDKKDFMTRLNDVVLFPSKYGGIFRASFSSILTAVYTSLPPPGALGSLSYASDIVVNTKPNNVTRTFSRIPDGCYGAGATLTFSVSFDSAVDVGGCPVLLFFINGRDRYAAYKGGSGTSVLNFDLDLNDDDVTFEVDYVNRFALQLKKCSFGVAGITESEPFIKRHSMNSIIDSNLTLAWVKYVESVVAPTSITGGGQNLRLVGTAVRPEDVNLAKFYEQRSYGIGDMIDVNIRFSKAVQLAYMGPRLKLRDISHPAYFEFAASENTFSFRLVPQIDDKCDGIAYENQVSLLTDSKVDITYVNDKDRCAAQNLPLMSAEMSDGLRLPSNRVVISSEVPRIISIAFADSDSTIGIGCVVRLLIEFSHDVIVLGLPYVNLYSEDGSNVFDAFYAANVTLERRFLQFEYALKDTSAVGILRCGWRTYVNLNGGSIRRLANFLPILDTDLYLKNLCCSQSCDRVSVNIIDSTPRVSRVFSSENGTFSSPDILNIYVEWTQAVHIIGNVELELNIYPDFPKAKFFGIESANVLKFIYTVRSQDATADLDYASAKSLIVNGLSAGYSGIFLGENSFNNGINIRADLTLPSPAARGSLGYENSIVLDIHQARIVKVASTPSIATAGDIVSIRFEFNDVVILSNRCVPYLLCPNTLRLDFNITDSATSVSNVRSAVMLISSSGSKIITFTYLVRVNDPSGSLNIGLETPFVFSNLYPAFESFLSGVKSASRIPSSVLDTTLTMIDNAQPVVLSVSSPNATVNYPFGVGDVIDVYVEMSFPVVAVSDTPVSLLLRLMNGQLRNATFVGSVLDITEDGIIIHPNISMYTYNDVCSNVLHFQYRVLQGDMALPLQYDSEDALVGDIRRCSIGKNPLIPAILTLPVPFSQGSLSACCRLLIDTTVPYVESIIPLKRPGIYGKNEEIVIVVRFNRPVIVFGGPPVLVLHSGRDGTPGNATYIESFDQPDVLLDIKKTDIIFRYIVREEDYTLSLHHVDSNSFNLNGSTIYADTTNPGGIVDTSLRDPFDFSLVLGKVHQQWKYKFPQRIDILMRDFYSSSPQRLTAKVEHLSGETKLFEKCCSGATFGKQFPLSRLGNNGTVYGVDTAIGYDYLFADTRLTNLALYGSANQSTIQHGGIPSRAIDGNNDPFFDDMSVSATFDTDVNAWWQVRLSGDRTPTVRSLQIWERKDEFWVPAIVTFVVKGYDQYPKGEYQLKIKFQSRDEAFLLSKKISMGALAEDITVIVSELNGLQQISVSRETITGIIGYDKGFGWKYRVTFNSVKSPKPSVEVVNMRLEGHLNNYTNAVDFHLDNAYSELSRLGRANSVADEGENENKWLTPFWIMLFDDSINLPPLDLEESKAAAVWKKQIFEIRDRIQLNFETDIVARYVKIQRNGNGSLSLAEVEVYSGRIDALEWYEKGSPIVPAPPMHPYQPLDSLHYEFSELKFDGRWILQIDDVGIGPVVKQFDGSSGGLGSISDWVLVVTDLAGLVHTYYMDLRAEIIHLPKYGDLFDARSMISTGGYGDWMDAFVVNQGPRIKGRVGGNRYLGPCYGVDTGGVNGKRSGIDGYRYCSDNFGVGPLLSRTQHGDVSNNYTFLRNERLVAYKPRLGYEGPDYFTYRIYDGQNIQEHSGGAAGTLSSGVTDNEVTLHVRSCRLYEGSRMKYKSALEDADNVTAFKKEINHPLCPCASTEYDIIGSMIECISGYDNICSSNSSRYHFLNLCSVCGSVASSGKFSEACTLELIRAVSFVTQRGFCDANPPMDCSSELVSLPGREAVNYLSLRPYTLHGSYTQLGNGMGGYGWYDSAMYV